MKTARWGAILFALFVFLGFWEAYGAEAKGYKIVLASFATFDEAKAKLNDLSQRIGDGEKGLQEQYGFEIAARPSGKAYMLAIEPLQTEQDAQKVLKSFKQFYPDSYINGYFGPTEGAVFLSKESVKEEANQTADGNTSNTAEPMKVVQAPKPADVSMAEPTQEEPRRTVWMLIGVLGIAALGLIGWLLKSKNTQESPKAFKEKYEETIIDEENEDRVEVIESEAYGTVGEPEIPKEVVPKQFEPESDIFFKLKKNSFFMTLLGELKSAADNKEHPRCADLMAELMRYQKNFKKSTMMDTIQKLVETKQYEQLSALINNEME